VGKVTGIEWADHTFNPWIGCAKVSPECQNCYAETLADRHWPGNWGPNAPRRQKAESGWGEPLAWNRAAEREGKKRRVFCLSLGDVFEDRPDLVSPRARLWDLIWETPHLIWMLLTKRPENARVLWTLAHRSDRGGVWQPNLWVGVTAGTQESTRRIPELLSIPVKTRFVSVEPLLEAIDIEDWLVDAGGPSISWVIAGGESGANARPAAPVWFRSLRDQCVRAGVPFFFKQWGEFATDPDAGFGESLTRMGKKAAGNLLDGRRHLAVPVIS
jgi:protein gp37